MSWTRRRFLGAAAAATASTALAGCGGFTKSGSAASANGLNFTTWGSDAELAGFNKAIAAFEAANSGTKITLNVVPFAQMYQIVDASLQSNTAPDVFRVDYRNFGKYAGRSQLLDLSTKLDTSFGSAFTDALWRAVQVDGKPYGVPHHTDTSAILYNKSAFEAAGITSVPTTLESAWTWQEFEQVAVKLQGKLPKDQYPFAYNWQGGGGTARWLSWLFQAGGRFLSEEMKTPAIDSDAGRSALDFTTSFFAKKYVPANDTIKSSTFASDLFLAQTVGMVFAGAFLLPDAAKLAKFEWGATFSPRNKRSGGDLGGNALVATAASKQGDLAARFLSFMVDKQTQQDFCATSSLLPTRKDLVTGGALEFAVRPELTKVFLGQASTVRPEDAAQVASPNMGAITTVLGDQLEKAFVSGQSTADTLAGMTAGISKALAG